MNNFNSEPIFDNSFGCDNSFGLDNSFGFDNNLEYNNSFVFGNGFDCSLDTSDQKIGTLMIQSDSPRGWLIAMDWQYEIYTMVKKIPNFNTKHEWTSEYMHNGTPYRICVEPNWENLWLVNINTKKRRLMIMLKYHSGADKWPER